MQRVIIECSCAVLFRLLYLISVTVLSWLRPDRAFCPGSRERLLVERVTAMLSEEVRARLNALVFGVSDEPTAMPGSWVSGTCWCG